MSKKNLFIMGRKIAVWVFFATVFYQFVDAGAELFVPFYERGGVVATLLFWLLPAGTAFILGFSETAEHATDGQRRKWVYVSAVIGAAVGQFLSIVVLLPTSALPDLTLVGGIILSGITALFVLISVAAGVLLVLAAHGDQDELISSRFTQITGATFLLFFLFTLSIEMSSLSSPYLTGNDAIVFLLAGVWFLIVARTLKQNNRNNEKEPSMA
jgi:hypothetical protein